MKRLSSRLPLISLLLVIIVLLSFLSLLIGPVRMNAVDAFQSLFSSGTDAFSIIWQVRMPHLVLTMLAGAVLASAGCVLLGVSGHWIVDSKIIKTLFVVSVLFSIGIIYMMVFAIPLTGFELRLAGLVDGASWTSVYWILPFAFIGIGISILYSKDLNAMVFGEYTAKTLGISVEAVRMIMLVAAVILCCAAFSVCGLAGLIWLIVPYFIRLVAGFNYKYLVPVSMLAGMAVFVLFDIFSRIIFPEVIPVGILLCVAGGPLYLYALYRRRLGL